MSGWRDVRNVLVVRLDNAGDVVMLGPALRAIKQAVPMCRLTLLATPAGGAVVPHLPEIDDLIVWRPIWQDISRTTWNPEQDRELIARLAERGFDGAIIFTSFKQDPHVPGYVAYLAGIPLRAGQSKEFAGATLTHEFPSLPDHVHQVERNLSLVERLGFDAQDRSLNFLLTPDNRSAAVAALALAGIDPTDSFVVIHPGASAPARRYPEERFAEVATLLSERGIKAVMTGTEKEGDLLTRMSRRSEVRVLDTSSSLGSYAGVIELASAVVCGNTLPLHLADALGTPVVALYSGTDLESQWMPRAVPHRLLRRETDCYPCYLIDCPIGKPCLDIEPAVVVSALEDLIPIDRPLVAEVRG
jgi:ADP-heptose:LPS heptosyltransferase